MANLNGSHNEEGWGEVFVRWKNPAAFVGTDFSSTHVALPWYAGAIGLTMKETMPYNTTPNVWLSSRFVAVPR